MSEPTMPPSPPEGPPPPPPQEPPAPAPPSGGVGAGTGTGQPNIVMVVLSYLYILAVVPLLVEKEDAEVQWHAKHGLLLFAIDFVIGAVFFTLGMVSGGFGCLLLPIQMILHLALFLVRIICIVKGIKGERFLLPGVSDLVDRF